MSNLVKLKKWFFIQEVSKYFDCSHAEVLQFALQGDLTISVRLVVPVIGRAGTLLPTLETSGKGAIPALSSPWFMGKEKITEIDGKRLCLGSQVVPLVGVYDLPMIGDEYLSVEAEYNKVLTGVEKSLSGDQGFFVSDGDQFFLLCRPAHDSDFKQYEEQQEEEWPPEYREEVYCPVSTMPEIVEFVVRPEALLELEKRLEIAQIAPTNKSAETKNVNSLYKLISLLAVISYNQNPREKGFPFNDIAKESVKYDLEMNEDTVRKWLRKSAKEHPPKMTLE